MVNHTVIHDLLVDKILKMPIDQWDKAVEMLKEAGDTELEAAEGMMSSLSVLAGEFSYYLGYRGAFGAGDHGHEKAYNMAEKKRKSLRKANGYSYP